MSISKMTLLACVAGLTMSFSALLAQGPVEAKKSGRCQKASSKAQPPAQEPAKQEKAAAKKGCCKTELSNTTVIKTTKKTGCCSAKTLLTDGPTQPATKKVATKANAGGQLNSRCYFTKKLVTSESPLVAYNGFAIRFCCKKCVGKFGKLTSRQKDGYVSMLVTPVNTKCPISGRTVKANAPSATYKANFVKFCCKNCLGKWEKADSELKSTIHAKLNGAPAKTGVEKGQPDAGKKGTPQACCDASEPCDDCKAKKIKK